MPQLTLSRPVKEQVKEIRFEKCDICGKEEKRGTLPFFNGGNLFPHNLHAHKECYLKALKEKFGFNGTGYEAISPDTVKIFSQTTGWETVDFEIMSAKIRDSIFEDGVFDYVLIIYDACTGEHLATYGITKQTAEFLQSEFGIEYEKLEKEVG